MRRLLRVLAILEPFTLAVLLLNLITVHVGAVASVLGPVHGACYVAILVLALLYADVSSQARLLALVPAVGGLLLERAAHTRGTTP